MTVTAFWGFESQAAASEDITLVGTASFSTSTVRTGAASIRCNPASGATGLLVPTSGFVVGRWIHFGMYVATLPSVSRLIFGQAPVASDLNMRLTSAGALEVRVNTTVLGTSSAAFATPGWHWVGVRVTTGTSAVFLQIDGVDEVTATATVSSFGNQMGFAGTEASAADVFFDDVIVDDTGFIAPSKVDTALPISVSATGTGWVGGGGGAAAATAVDNTPPVGVADTGTNTSQIRNATSAANSDMDFNLETYSTLGIAASDTVLAVQPVVMTAAPVSTSAKAGQIGTASNPAITPIALAAGGTSGAFWSGTTGGTFPTGWKFSGGTLTTSPSVTLGSSPVVRIRQVTASTRIAMVCFAGLKVAWTPIEAPAPLRPRYPQLLAQ